MNKPHISSSISCSHFIALLFLLIIYISTQHVDGLQDDNNDGQIKSLLIPDNLFLLKTINKNSDHSTIRSNYDLYYNPYRMIPFKKRTIPIELQKALYAHGIVGRRR